MSLLWKKGFLFFLTAMSIHSDIHFFNRRLLASSAFSYEFFIKNNILCCIFIEICQFPDFYLLLWKREAIPAPKNAFFNKMNQASFAPANKDA